MMKDEIYKHQIVYDKIFVYFIMRNEIFHKIKRKQFSLPCTYFVVVDILLNLNRTVYE